MARVQVVCIKKSGSSQRWEAITHIGYKDGRATTVISEAEAIRRIELRTYEFYVRDLQKNEANVEVAETETRRKYLRTVKDSVTTDNLLSLPICS